MFAFQIFMMALRGLRANLLRSLLATLGVIIGGLIIAMYLPIFQMGNIV